MTRHDGWWRTNRYWLPAVPLALLLALLASSYNVKTFWYDAGLHRAVATADAGESVTVTDDYDDALGPTTRTFTVGVEGVSVQDTYPADLFSGPAAPPAGVEAVAATLSWEADPDQVLRGCFVALVDEDGRRYEVPNSTQVNVCTPEDREGPEAPIDAAGERGQVPAYSGPRPATWTTEPVFLVPEGRRITQVLVWWTLPRYVRLTVPR